MTKEECLTLETQWRERVERWQASGQSQRAYCQANDLNYHRFGYWHRKINGVTKPVRAAGFAQVTQQISSPSAGLSIRLPSGAVLYGVDSDNLPVVYQLLSRLA